MNQRALMSSSLLVLALGRPSVSRQRPVRSHRAQNGQMTDLNSLLPSSLSGVTLFGASSINNEGQIVAFVGTSQDGPMQDYLLTPPGEAPLAGVTNLPEPSTLAFFGLLVGCFCIRRAFKRMR